MKYWSRSHTFTRERVTTVAKEHCANVLLKASKIDIEVEGGSQNVGGGTPLVRHARRTHIPPGFWAEGGHIGSK